MIGNEHRRGSEVNVTECRKSAKKKTALRNELSLTKVIFKLSIEMKIEIITRFSVKFDINFR